MQRPLFTCPAAFYVLLFSAHLSAAEDPRDLSGVWQAFASVPPFADAAPELSTDGEVLIADFNARYPNPVDPAAFCVPPGMPEMMTLVPGRPFELVQSFSRIAMLGADGRIRSFAIGEAPFPEEARRTRNGYSIAHWEGDTLVVETRFLDAMLAGRWPRSEDMVVVERMTRMRRAQVTATPDPAMGTAPSDDTALEIKLTITDATLYRAPQSVTIYYQHAGALPMEVDCPAELWRNALDAANQ